MLNPSIIFLEGLKIMVLLVDPQQLISKMVLQINIGIKLLAQMVINLRQIQSTIILFTVNISKEFYFE